MADQISLKNYYGDVISVGGKCWEFLGVEKGVPTHTSADVSAIFANCNDCLSGGDTVDPPSGLSQLLGDVHYVYGKPDSIAVNSTLASLNVDDNSSDNEIVWWTHTEGGVEYVIKYSQQTFAFTVDGRSIDQVVVSASDGSVNDIYTITDPQSATRRNGLPWVNDGVSGLGTAMTYNVTERIIPPEDCCNILGDYFALFNLNVQPTSGFNNIDEYGGALWYIWKKAETFASTPINTASSAGMDGIGLFLSGLDGYTSRSQFETTPSSVREVYNAANVTDVFARLNELASIDGFWNADWDPLAQDPIDCPLDTCGTCQIGQPTGIFGGGLQTECPTMLMTMAWSDSDVTKNFYGCTWCNGETKEVFPTLYFNGKVYATYYGSPAVSYYAQRWVIDPVAPIGQLFGLGAVQSFSGMSDGNNWRIMNFRDVPIGPNSFNMELHVVTALSMTAGYFENHVYSVSNFATFAGGGIPTNALALAPVRGTGGNAGPARYLNGYQKTNQFTTSSGITFSWTPNGW